VVSSISGFRSEIVYAFLTSPMCAGRSSHLTVPDYVTLTTIKELTTWSRALSSEAASSLATQEFPKILWNPKVHYRVHKRPPVVPSLSQINPTLATTSFFCNITFMGQYKLLCSSFNSKENIRL
jgi:hypothetical protein